MLTGSEKKYLALTVFFLATGTGIKAYKHASIQIGPADSPLESAVIDSAASPTIALNASPSPSVDSADLSVRPSVALADSDSHASAGELADSGADAKGKDESGNARARSPGKQKLSEAPAEKISLNQAGIQELTSIKGIGEKTAATIMEYRRAHGPFRNWNDLLKVKGIGEKKLERIRPYLTLSNGGGPGSRTELAEARK